ncbi:hypothetical protein [Lentzea sp.]|uniref:hypothetical protein n=1 Tax=Lentzea sp. TaxID=56099 RepID=UPI002BF710FA|nr:hypothetical protein [Lentzea sp.]HUQ61426.1 hypothetical protein [Lentzea sp.]
MNTFAMTRWSPGFVRSFHDPGPPAVHFPAALELFEHSTEYTSGQYARAAADAGVRLSVGRKGQCWDNAVAESFFATIKTEFLAR